MSDMTNAAAIDLLDNLIGMVDDNQENDYDEAFRMAINALTAQDGKHTNERTETHACDLIDRQAAVEVIDAVFPVDPMKSEYAQGVACGAALAKTYIEQLPSAQPERLTDDDFETIRIHLNAHKEKLCNQHRWEEADEYQRIIDRFMAFASAQPEIIQCKDCKHKGTKNCVANAWATIFGVIVKDDFYCGLAERRTDE